MITKTIDHILSDLVSITLSKPCPKAPYLKIKIRQIAGNKRKFLVEQFTATQSFHATMTRQETGEFLKQSIGINYKNAAAELTLKNNDTELVHFLTNKKGKTTVIQKKLKKPPLQNNENDLELQTNTPVLDITSPICHSHNRKKKYLLEEGIPIPFLQHLGVMTPEGTVIADKYSKFKQINRFLEFINDILPDIAPKDGKPLKVVDFGCGKSYLTFAVYHFLTEVKNIPVSITGLDLKEDVIQLCSTLAKEFRYEHLHFECASIESYFASLKNGDATTDLVISLHACDTATDYALASAIAQKTKAILSVPCCQHELNTALQKSKKNDTSPFRPFYQYGLIRERFSSLATDLTRALLLEKNGYAVQVLEFIDVSHTPKNILLRAVLKQTPFKQIKADASLDILNTAFKHSDIDNLCLQRLLDEEQTKAPNK